MHQVENIVSLFAGFQILVDFIRKKNETKMRGMRL